MYKMIYHGSNVLVTSPEVLTNGFYKDFGYGFYCTDIERQARRWALSKRGIHIVNVYGYIENKDLNAKKFDKMSEEWLDFVVNCRKGIKHTYDIVEEPMADDTIWNYVEDFIEGEISRDSFWELVKFKYPTHQIAFCTEQSLETIKYEGCYTV